MKAVWKDAVIAESDATVMVEGNYYFPEASVNRQFISFSNHKTSCSWKGQASYYSLIVNGELNPDGLGTTPSQKRRLPISRATWRSGRVCRSARTRPRLLRNSLRNLSFNDTGFSGGD